MCANVNHSLYIGRSKMLVNVKVRKDMMIMKYKKIKDKLIPDANNRIKIQDGKVIDPMSEQVNGEWMINPVALTENNVFVVCPYCGKIHVHGLCGGSYAGIRTVDCGNGIYSIKPVKA